MSLCKCVTSEFTKNITTNISLPPLGIAFLASLLGSGLWTAHTLAFPTQPFFEIISVFNTQKPQKSQTTASWPVFPVKVLNLMESICISWMKEKHHVELSKTWWVLLCIKILVLQLKKGRRSGGGVRLSHRSWHLVPKSSLCCHLCCYLSWSYESATQASTKGWCLLPPAALDKQKGHFNQGGVKGGSETHSLGGVVGCLVQIMFLTIPRGKESLLPHIISVSSQRALTEGAKLHEACGPHHMLGSSHIHGICGGKRCHMVFPKCSTERGTFCTHQRPGVYKTAFWSLCSTVCLIMPQDCCKKLRCW